MDKLDFMLALRNVAKDEIECRVALAIVAFINGMTAEERDSLVSVARKFEEQGDNRLSLLGVSLTPADISAVSSFMGLNGAQSWQTKTEGPAAKSAPTFAVPANSDSPRSGSLVNKAREWLLGVEKNGIVTKAELKKATGYRDSQVHPIIQQLRWDKILRCKRGITGKFLRGVYVKTAGADAIIKRRLRGRYS